MVKAAWFGARESKAAMRRWCFQLLSGSYFRSVGNGTKFYGKVRFGSVHGNIVLGKNCMLGHDVFFSAGKNCSVNIGDNCSLNNGCHIVALYGITIGDNTHIGELCSIRDQNHRFEDPKQLIRNQGFSGAPIHIGKDVWIGRGVFITPGVEIGDGCVIGANSVVTKSLEPFSVAVGSPAKMIRKRGAKL